MQLLPGLLNIEIQSDIILSEILELEEGRYHVMISLVKYNDFPYVVWLREYFGE
jgi:hypothetical protein